MLGKIINNLAKPHLIPLKIFGKIQFFLNKTKYKKDFFENQQNEIFNKFDLDRNSGLKKLDNLKNNYQFLVRGMASEHEVFFSSLSLNSKINIEKILEIGTFDGKNSFLLSLLFNNVSIDTIDLEKESEDFKKSYNRENKLNEFVKSRDNILSKNDKIFFRELNSIKLCNENNKKYDLIWIDGAHGYPTVCIDIINSIKLINDNGVIMCDDIYVNKIKSDKMYQSTAAFETLSELKKENLIQFELIYKRLDADSNCDKKRRKYVAIIKKTDLLF